MLSRLCGVVLTLTLAVTLSIDPTTYTITFTPDPDNAEVAMVIEGNPSVNPYIQWNAFAVDGDDSAIIITRRRLPKGSYTVWAGVYRWVGNELVVFESSQVLIIHVP